MANELTLDCVLKYLNGDYDITKSETGLKVDVSGDNYICNVQNIGTSEEALTLGDVSAGGFMFLQNLDATNYVEIRPAQGVADLIKMKAGEPALFRLTGDASPYAIANTAACDLLVVLIPD